jgi:hypothetical protein
MGGRKVTTANQITFVFKLGKLLWAISRIAQMVGTMGRSNRTISKRILKTTVASIALLV